MKNNPIRSLILAIGCCLTISACTKSGTHTVPAPAAGTAPVYDFTYSGTLYAGDTVQFHNSGSAAHSYVWYFGDSTTSSGVAPSHVYSASGTYVATLIIDGNFIHAVHKTVNIVVGSVYTARIGGMRHWHHGLYHADVYGAHDTTVMYADTTFAVTVLSPALVVVGTDTLSYSFRNDSLLLYFPIHRPDNYPASTYLGYFPASGGVKYEIYMANGHSPISELYRSF